MRLFHRTDHADAILREGFRDAEGHYGFFDEEENPVPVRGVWLSETPLDENEGADGDQLLQIELPDAVALEHEVVEEGKPYREFLIPASVLNQHGPPRLVSQEEEDEIIDLRRFPPPDRRSE
jgi:hypothetical protein